MNPTFSVFGVVFYPYSLLMIAGAAACILVFLQKTHQNRKGVSSENEYAVEMLLIAMAAGVPAAMCADSLFKWRERGGFVLGGATFYGGLIASLLVWSLLLCCKRKKKVSALSRLDDLAAGIPLGHMFGRIGCFFGGCCFGTPTDPPLGVIFPDGSPAAAVYGENVPVHPVQLYEALFLLILSLYLFFFQKRHSFSVYLIVYGLGRFILEYFRADERGRIFSVPLSPAQVISVFLIVVGGVVLILREQNGREKKKAPLP